jgi:hypothetical protein
VIYLTTLQCLRLGRLGGRVVSVLATGQRVAVSNRFHGMLKNSCSPTRMNILNSYFLRPSPTRARDVSGDGQSALVDKLGVSPSRSRLLTGSHRYHPGIVQEVQGRSAETSVSPHHNNQIYTSTIYVSELRHPTDLLFTPYRLYKHGTMVEWYRQRKIHDSSTRALWQSYQQSSSSKQEERAKEIMHLSLRIIFVHTFQVIFYMP